MNSEWLHWYYLVYWLPFGIAVGVLLVSGLGGHHAQGAHGAHAGFPGHGGIGGHTGPLGHSAVGGHSAGAGHAGPVHAAPGHPASTQTASHAPASAAHTGTGDRPGSTLQQEAQADWSTAHHHLHLGWRTSHSVQAGDRDALGLAGQLLSFFGFGRAPITILAASLLIGWGLCGLMTTEYIETPNMPPSVFILPALIAAILGALLFTKFFGELAARFTPEDESYAVTRESLVGLTGTVVYPVTETGGRIHVFDQHRTLHVEPARMRTGRPAAARGEEVIVYQVDVATGCLLVDTAVVEDSTSVESTGVTKSSGMAKSSGVDTTGGEAGAVSTPDLRAEQTGGSPVAAGK